MSFNVSGNASWLSVAPASGFSAGRPGNRLSLTVSVDASELSQGSHRALLFIAGTGFRNPPQRVNVSVTVAPGVFAGSRALEYDTDNSLSIDLDEVLEAVRDYFAGLISLEDVLKIVRAVLCWLISPQGTRGAWIAGERVVEEGAGGAGGIGGGDSAWRCWCCRDRCRRRRPVPSGASLRRGSSRRDRCR